MEYVEGALIARSPLTRFTQLRRVGLILIALALAVTVVAIEAPAAQGHTTADGNQAGRVIRYAKSHLGAGFRLGTEGMRYFDCSGLVFRVFTQAGLINKIGGNRKRAAGYYGWFRKRGLVSRSNPRPGDLIVYTKHGRIAHIGIAISSTRAISALTSGVRTHRHKTLDTRFMAYLHVGLTN